MQLQQKLRERIPLIIAIICGILAILLLNVYLGRRESEIWQRMKLAQQQTQQQPQPARAPEETGIVLIAQRDIPPQNPITADDLLMREMPVQYIQPGAVTSLAQVIGQIASTPIAAGEQIVKTKLLPPGKIGKSLSEITPEGKRAVTVSVDNISSIGGLIKPGDYVDVFALISPPSEAGWPQVEKTTPHLVSLFQGVEVLAVGDEFVAPSGASSRGSREKERKLSTTAAGTVTLALNPQEAILLSFVQERGKIKLALRSLEDAKVESIKPADWDTLFKYLYPTKELDSEREQPVVEIYRGLKKEVVPLSEGKE